jgi:large subunit ribosomal protein L4
MDDTKKVLLVDGGDIDKKLKLATQNLHYVNVLPSIVSSVISVLEVCLIKLSVLCLVYFWLKDHSAFMKQGLNVYSILQHDTLVMSRAAINRIVERMHTPINR